MFFLVLQAKKQVNIPTICIRLKSLKNHQTKPKLWKIWKFQTGSQARTRAHMVDPLYFVVQLILFPTAGVLFGIFLHELRLEVQEYGWQLSPRCVRHLCLCASSFVLWVAALDPTSVLGIFPTPWRYFIESVSFGLVINSLSSTLYMYFTVLSKRYLSNMQVPACYTALWILPNVIFGLANALTALIGAILDDSFWTGVSVAVIFSQEMSLVILVHASLHYMQTLLTELEQTSSANFKAQKRKLWVIRLLATLIIGLGTFTQLINPESELYGILRPGLPNKGANPQVQ